MWILYTPWECRFIHTTGVQMIDNWCVCVCELELYKLSKKKGTVTVLPLAFCWSLQIVQICFFLPNTITGREHDGNYGSETASDNIALNEWALQTNGIFCREGNNTGLRSVRGKNMKECKQCSQHPRAYITPALWGFYQFPGNTNCRIRLKATENISFFFFC